MSKLLTIAKAEESKKKGWFIATDSEGTKYGTNIPEIVNYAGVRAEFEVGEKAGKYYINSPLPEISKESMPSPPVQDDPNYSYFLRYATDVCIALIQAGKMADLTPSNLAIFINTLQENLLTGRDAWFEQRDIPF